MTTTGAAPTDDNGEATAVDDAERGGSTVSRRGALRAIGGGVAAGAALGAAPATARAQSDGTDLASWFDDVSNYDGVVDETGSGSVTVDVGVEANGGAFGFGPAAVRVDPGTTVTWAWTGGGGSHNVAADGYESELTDSSDHTFEHTFEEAGVSTYICTPHETLGMKGAVVVGDAEVNESGGGDSTESGGDGAGDGSGDGGTSTEAVGDAQASGGDGEEELRTPDAGIAAPFGDAGAHRLGGLALGGIFGFALASPGLFGAFLRLTGRGDDRPADRVGISNSSSNSPFRLRTTIASKSTV